MRISLMAPIALCAALTLSACADGALAPQAGTMTAAASKGPGSNDSTSSTTGERVRRLAYMTPPAGAPYANAKGKAKWDARYDDNKREFEIEVEHLPSGLTVEFFFNGERLGAATTDAYGEAELEFSTEYHQFVPESVAGATVEVRTTDGAVIVTGAFVSP